MLNIMFTFNVIIYINFTLNYWSHNYITVLQPFVNQVTNDL